MMSWNPKDEYANETPGEIDYANPTFYKQNTPGTPRSAQPVQSLEPVAPYPDYTRESPSSDGYDPALMTPYSGPSDIEGYTTDVGAEQREAAKYGNAEGSKKRKGLAGLGGIGAALSALLLKFPFLLSFIKFGWLGFSALFSVVVYALIFGWPFAIGLVALLFVHEMGHAIVMKLKKVPIGGMIFIPLVGAAVIMRQMPKNAKDEAEIGIAGPIAGGLAAGFCLLIAYLSPLNPGVWGPLAYFGFLLNLFNLVPIIPFDGGRVLAAIDRRIWIVGFLGLVAFQLWEWFWLKNISSPWLLLFIIMAATQLMMRNNAANTSETQAYYAVPVGERIALGLVYFGLAALLVLGMALAHSLMYSAL